MGYLGKKPAEIDVDIADASISATELAANSVDSSELVDGSIDTSHIAASQVTLAKMAANSIDSDQYVDGSIDTAHIAASQITNALMADDAIDSAEIADGAIDLAHMSVNSIDSDQYVDGSIDAAHLAPAQTNITSLGTLTALVVDDITINGSTISHTSNLTIQPAHDLVLDAGTDIVLDAGGADIFIKDDGTTIAKFTNSSSNFVITSEVDDKDIIFKGQDSTSEITALSLDMSAAGDAHFNRNVGIGAAPTNGGISTAGSPVLSISGAVPELNFVDTDSGKNDYWIRVSDGLQFGEAGDSRMYLKNGGNLGIGTTSPNAKLEISESADGAKLRLNRAGVAGWDISIGNSSTLSGVGAGALELLPQNANTANEFAIGTAGSTAALFHLTNSQNYFAKKVGIATANPNAPLQIDQNVGGTDLGKTSTILMLRGANGDEKYSHIGFQWGPYNNDIHPACTIGWQMKSFSGNTNGDLVFGTRSVTTDTAPTERMRIHSNGNVGIGTTLASELLHLYGKDAAQKIRIERREVDGAMDDNDEIGALEFWTNEDTYASGASSLRAKIMAEIENTSSGTNLQFWTGPTAGSSGIAMRIGADGGVLIGNRAQTGGQFSPTSKLVVGAGANGGTTPAASFQANTSTSSGSIVVWYTGGGGEVGAVGMSNLNAGSTVTYGGTSDYRLKENVDYTWNATTRLKQLKPARFNWIEDDTNTLQDGFLAHEVENIVPEAVMGQKDAVKEDDSVKPQMMDNAKLVPLLVKTIQELEARIATLEG